MPRGRSSRRYDRQSAHCFASKHPPRFDPALYALFRRLVVGGRAGRSSAICIRRGALRESTSFCLPPAKTASLDRTIAGSNALAKRSPSPPVVLTSRRPARNKNRNRARCQNKFREIHLAGKMSVIKCRSARLSALRAEIPSGFLRRALSLSLSRREVSARKSDEFPSARARQLERNFQTGRAISHPARLKRLITMQSGQVASPEFSEPEFFATPAHGGNADYRALASQV